MKIKKKIDISKVSKEFFSEIKKERDSKRSITLLEDFGRDLSSATNSTIWFCIKDSFYSITNDLKMDIEKSVLNESYKLKLPMLFNGVVDHQLYNPKIDNPKNLELKDILYYPIINNQDRVIAIFKSIITADYIHQFIHKDIENLREFISFALKIIEERVSFEAQTKKEPKESIVEKSKEKDEKQLEESADLNQKVESLLLEKNRLKARESYFVELVHNLRLPINSILGYSNFIDEKYKDEDKSCESISNIIDSGHYIEEVIESILNFSQINGEIFEVKNSEFFLLDIYEYLVDMFVNYANKKGIFFNTFYDTSIPTTFISDKEKLQQVIISLMENAINRTPAFGKIDFEINYDKQNNLINFSIVDSGQKITQEEKKELFIERYEEAKSSIIKDDKMQIRLPFIKKILTLLGSDIKVESDKETSFSFSMNAKESRKDDDSIFECSELKKLKIGLCLPNIEHLKETKELLLRYFKNFGIDNIVEFEEGDKTNGITHLFYMDNLVEDEELERLSKEDIKVIVIAKKLSSLKLVDNIEKLCIPFKATKIYDILLNSQKLKKNILIIDDNIESLNHLKNRLSRLGGSVVVGSSGKDAINIFVDFVVSDKKIDIIFINDDMCDTDGIEASKEILDLSTKYNIDKIPIIITTNTSDKKEIKAIKKLGIDMVIKKPISYDIIRKIYNKY